MSYTASQLAEIPWIVSTDTLKPEDLLVSFWQAAEQVHRIAYSGLPFAADRRDLASALVRLAGEDSSESDWDDALAQQAIEDLSDYLSEHAPAGFYFGSNEGDGACFGFWLADDWTEALSDRGLAMEDPETAAQLVQLFEDHGLTPDTLADGLAGEADGYSPEQAGAAWCEEFAVDCGMVPDDLQWPLNCLDWERAWRELEMGDGYSAEPNPGAGADYLILRPV